MRKLIKKALRGILDKQGFEIVAKYQLDSLALCNHLRELFSYLNVDCVLDVGAHYGEYGVFLRNEVGYKGRLISFEPLSENFKELQKTCSADPDWTAVPMALGDKRGTMDINVTERTTFTSFLTPNEEALSKFATEKMKSHASVKRVETVRIERLEDIYSLYLGNASHSIYLKMDTQGFDLEVMRGAGERIKNIAALQTELSMVQIYRGMPDYVTVISEMSKHGFEPSGMFPLTSDKKMRLVELDCTLIRADLN